MLAGTQIVCSEQGSVLWTVDELVFDGLTAVVSEAVFIPPFHLLRSKDQYEKHSPTMYATELSPRFS